jgi:hypothetical protein
MKLADIELSNFAAGSLPAVGQANPQSLEIASPRVSALPDHVIALLLASLVPALFWTGLLWLISLAWGVELSAVVLGAVFLAISGFLGVVCSAVFANR